MTRPRGFTIIEFMIAMTLSLLVLAALTAAFVASSRSRAEIERANEQIENGRFALQILMDDLETAGFLSHLDLDVAMTADTDKVLPPPAKPTPCIAATSAATALTELRGNLAMHIQGYDLPDSTLDTTAELDAAGLDCLDDVKTDSDIILVRRTATCVGGAANCAMVANAPYFQASLCSTHLNSSDADDYYRLDTTVANLNRTQRDCATTADRRQFLTHIYYVANNDVAGDGIPTLKRAELVQATGTAADFTVVPLAHGIQDLQFEYGVDTDGDGAPDAFTSSPDTYGTANCAGTAGEKAQCIQNWRDVMTVRINLLARNSTRSRDHVDSKVYRLGENDDGTPRCALDVAPDATPIQDADGCFAFEDGFKRHVYQTSVRLNNPAGRREQ